MPEQPNRAANFQGGSSDYWDGLLEAYFMNQIELSLIRDGMTTDYSGGGGEAGPPQPPHFMEDAHAAGVMVIGGEVIRG